MIESRRCTVDLKPAEYPRPAEGLLRMDANTNLYGPNPAVERALRAGASAGLNHYPSGHSDDLREAIAREFGVTAGEVIVGAGSDEVLDTLAKAFLNPGDRVAVPAPSFVMYAFYGRLNFGEVVEVPLRDGFQLDVDRLLAARAKITFLASPNNPTGNAWPRAEIERIVRESEGLVVVDEAYAEFCGQDFARRTRGSGNMVVARTLSKSHGLAGLRVGFGIGPREIVDRLHAVKTPFTVGSMAERIALEALADRAYVDESRRMIETERPWLAARLRAVGLRPFPTDANFMLVDCGGPAAPVVRKLRERGILVRDMGDFRGLANCFRATVGRREHNERLAGALT